MEKMDVLAGVGIYPREITVYLPESSAIRQMIYFHASPQNVRAIGEELWRKLKEYFGRSGTGLVLLEVEDWNRDLSPWPAGGIFREGEDFAGGGEAYLEDLCSQVVPRVEGRFAEMSGIERRVIGGYSMGGLFALYAAMESPLFSDLISVSGSLWYEGIVEYVSGKLAREGEMSGLGDGMCRGGGHFAGRRRAYFSLGQREPKTRNGVMRRVGEQTDAIADSMAAGGFSVHFQWNPGNHFQDEVGRMERGIRHMLCSDW